MIRERIVEKATSVRTWVLLMLTVTLCINALRSPVDWKEMFGSALSFALGYFYREAEKKPTTTEGKPTP